MIKLVSFFKAKGKKFNSRCLLIAETELKTYFSISGILDYESESSGESPLPVRLLEDFIRGIDQKFLKHEIIRLTDDTLYYYEDNNMLSCICYGDARKFKADETKVSRMFSCTEKKVLSKFKKEKTIGSITRMHIKYAPCEMCRIMMTVVNFPLNKCDYGFRELREFNDLAKKIKGVNNIDVKTV